MKVVDRKQRARPAFFLRMCHGVVVGEARDQREGVGFVGDVAVADASDIDEHPAEHHLPHQLQAQSRACGEILESQAGFVVVVAIAAIDKLHERATRQVMVRRLQALDERRR